MKSGYKSLAAGALTAAAVLAFAATPAQARDGHGGGGHHGGGHGEHHSEHHAQHHSAEHHAGDHHADHHADHHDQHANDRRAAERREHADRVRNAERGRRDDLFTHDWNQDHRADRDVDGRHDHHIDHHDAHWDRHYWRRHAAWGGLTGWVAGAWGAPFFYDYGPGGNVYFENNEVYRDGQPIATAADYAQQAITLADTGAQQLDNEPAVDADTSDTDANEQQNWLPLGVFALTSENTDDADPATFMQLAVNKQGAISGAWHNVTTNETRPIHGAIDPKTQRAAWFIGDNRNDVFDTGAYNLTQSETPVLMHEGGTETERGLLVRLDGPDAGNANVSVNDTPVE